MTNPSSPIADLSYRGYDGPLRVQSVRWWVIALAGLKLAVAKKGFRTVAVVACLPHLASAVMLYFSASAPSGLQAALFSGPESSRYATLLFKALEGQLLWLFVIAMMAGPGSIAADTQANALLVYLSKPLTKTDYLLGKWMSVFLAVYAVAAGPALALYLYCLFSYYDDGFLKNEPWLLVRMLVACAAPASVHASLLVGVSAWSKSPRMAGAVYAGLVFVSFFIANVYADIRFRGQRDQGIVYRHLSVGGVIKGSAQNVYDITLTELVGRRRRRELPNITQVQLPPPNRRLLFGMWATLVVGGTLAARARIRAVEVVSG